MPLSPINFCKSRVVLGRIPELSIKFETRPDLRSTGKKVTLQVTGENGIAVRASINRKTLKKQVEKMDSFEQWIGVLSGKMQGIADDGVIELEGAGMNVFERKSKEKSPAAEEGEKVVNK